MTAIVIRSASVVVFCVLRPGILQMTTEKKLLFDVDPRSIGVMVESEEGDGEDTYLPVLMFHIMITG